MVPQAYMTYIKSGNCPVCQKNIQIDKKNRFIEHKINTGATCYGSHMPEKNPEIFQEPPVKTRAYGVSGNWSNGSQWQPVLVDEPVQVNTTQSVFNYTPREPVNNDDFLSALRSL